LVSIKGKFDIPKELVFVVEGVHGEVFNELWYRNFALKEEE
jgi:hypothetical protein